MPEPSAAEQTSSVPEDSTGDAMLAVDFIAGRIRLPLAKLAEWVPQHVIVDEGVFFPRIQAVCNGTVIAEGELVQMGNQVGFRVTRIVRPM